MREVLFDLALQVPAAVLVLEVDVAEAVPLVEGEHERASGFEHQVDDAHVLLAEGLRDVEHDDGDLGGADRGGGHLEPRTVEVGDSFIEPATSKTGASIDMVEIRAGLSADERVVTGVTFLVDAESRLRAALIPSP